MGETPKDGQGPHLGGLHVWRVILIVGGIVVVLAGGAVALVVFTPLGDQLSVSMVKKAEKATEVRVERLERGEMVRTVNAPGEITPRTKVAIGARVSAQIVALPFREGDEVKSGDVVVRLDSGDVVASLESAQAQLEVRKAQYQAQEANVGGMRATLREARSELERVRTLFASQDRSQADLDRAGLRVEELEAAVAQAEAGLLAERQGMEIARANIRRAEKDVENTTITSPIDGRITRLNAEVGEQVVGTLNSPGSTIMEISDLRTMVMKARVDETSVAPVREGQRAKVYLVAYPDITIPGRVERVALRRDETRDGTPYVEAEILLQPEPGSGRLMVGLTASADIEVETLFDAIMVPSQAVLDKRVDELPKSVLDSSPLVNREKTFARAVFKLVEGKAVLTPVLIGPSNLSRTVVLGGLSPGDVIVTGPYKTIVTLKHEQTIAEEGAAKPPADETAKTQAPASAEQG